jgi:hypothetical protein
MAGVGVGGLGLVANQYKKALTTRPAEPSVDAARRVDGFLAARRAIRASQADAEEAFRRERSHALTASGMTLRDYVAVRKAWRGVKAGSLVVDPYLAAALAARPSAVSDGALPPELERLDDELK